MEWVSQGYMEDKKLLASVALFRKLYDNGKDSYDVLSEFIRSVITIKGFWQFSVEECSFELQGSFGFNIPAAVIKSCLRRRLKGEVELSHGLFKVKDNFRKTAGLEDAVVEAQREQESIVVDLINFSENLNQRSLSDLEKIRLGGDFNQFFLGALKPGANHICISQFIVSKSSDADFMNRLNRMEEGLILYQGIEHSSSVGDSNIWQSDLTIYLDTEVLFWANGYDGILFKSIFDEFIELIREINKKSHGGATIVLRYFPEVRAEVDSIFAAADSFVGGRRISDPSKTAMQYILAGCRTRSDVVEKKASFYSRLKGLKIAEEVDRDYYARPEFVCESLGLINKISADFPSIPTDKIASVLKFFTKINFLREGVSNRGIERVKAIIISGKNISRSVAFHSEVLGGEGSVPFSTDIEFFTERLWFKLGKGFGGGCKTPVAFDVLARARVIISSQICSKVSDEFRLLVARVDSGELSVNDASYIVSELKGRPVKPEDLDADNLPAVNDFLHVDSVEAGVRKLRMLEGKATELDEKSQLLIDAESEIRSLKYDGYRKDVSHWRAQGLNVISSCRRLYVLGWVAYWFIVFIIPFILLILLRSDGDTALAQLGFLATIASILLVVFGFGLFSRCISRFVRKVFYARVRSGCRKPVFKH